MTESFDGNSSIDRALTARRRAAMKITGPLLTGIAFCIMLNWTWGGWPDPLVDFGRELYVAWQLSTGKLLYRDIAYFNGPLSPYFNATLFAIFGASLRTLVIANIAIAWLTIAMILRLFRLAGDRLSAAVAALSFVALFACIQVVAIGNYNWITPYSHEMTHGVALSLGAILATTAFAARPNFRRAAIIGGLLGLVFLTKPEIFLAAAPAVCAGFALLLRARVKRNRWRMAIAFICAMLFIPVLAAILLSQSWRGVLGAWRFVFDQRLADLPFYRLGMGLDNWRASARLIVIYTTAAVLIGAIAITIDRFTRSLKPAARVAIGLGCAAALSAALIGCEQRIGWVNVFRSLAPITAVSAAVLSFVAIRRPRPKKILRAMLAIFAALLLAKLLLAVRIYHYGFALAMPATLVVFSIAICWLPRALPGALQRRNQQRGFTLPAVAIALLAVFVLEYLREYDRSFHYKPVVIAAHTLDEFRADSRGRLLETAVKLLDSLPAGATVAVLPDGAMASYLSRRENPSGYVNLMPPEVIMFGQNRILESFKSNPPDYVLLMQSDARDYGYHSFEDYGNEIVAWVKSHYAGIARMESDPRMHLMARTRQ